MNSAITSIGVDGGTTKTHLAAVDKEGQVVLFNETGCTNAYAKDGITENLLHLFGPLNNAVIDVAVFTLAGWDFEEDQKLVREQVEKALIKCNINIKKILFENDIFAVYYSGIGNANTGVALAAGSGTVGIAVHGKNVYRTTGYGYIAGEWGAGWEMADYAIHLACSSLLEREETYPILIQKTFQYFNVSSLDELVNAIVHDRYSLEHRGLFLKDVFNAYQQGCAGAKKVVEKGSIELTKTIAALLKKIPMQNVPVVLGGSVFKSMDLLQMMKAQMKKIIADEHEFRVVQSDPVWGAVLWASAEAGINTNTIAEKIKICCITNP